MKKLTFLMLCLVLGTGLSAQRKTYYVSPEGSDAASGLSVKDAWQTLDKVNDFVLQPGDKVLLRRTVKHSKPLC